METLALGCTRLISEPPKYFSVHISSSPVSASPHAARVGFLAYTFDQVLPCPNLSGGPPAPSGQRPGSSSWPQAFPGCPLIPSPLPVVFSVPATLTSLLFFEQGKHALASELCFKFEILHHNAAPKGRNMAVPHSLRSLLKYYFLEEFSSDNAV